MDRFLENRLTALSAGVRRADQPNPPFVLSSDHLIGKTGHLRCSTVCGITAVERWRAQQLSAEAAKLTIYQAFIEGDLEVPGHLAGEYTNSIQSAV